MTLRNNETHYGFVAKFLHWSIGLLVIGALIAGFVMTNMEDSPQKWQMYSLHKSTGLLILGLMVLRLLWALTNVKPRAHSPRVSRIQVFFGRVAHLAFYVVLIAMPMSGLLFSSYAGRETSFYGLFNVKFPVAENRTLADFLVEMHEIIAWGIIALLVLHIIAVLIHKFYYKDNVLRSMMFGRKK